MISEIARNASKEIWDVDYMSTSDEEDNDSEDPDSDLEEQVDSDGETIPVVQKPKKKREKHDVVRTLIERDDELLTRDLNARLWKIQNWKKARKRFGFHNEDYDCNEEFKEWLDYEHDHEVYYAMGTKYKTSYKKGD